MDIVKFSVTNFRSITSAYKIPIAKMTVLIGKNNEGKSNMLHALNIAMFVLRRHAERGISPFFPRRIYDWERDFPISLQKRKTKLESIFRLEFSLNKKEIAEFKKEIKSNLNGTLPIEIKIGSNGKPKISVIKKGKGSKTLNIKSEIIASYISKRISFNYIPAVRTDKESTKVVNEMLSDELAQLENDPKYNDALKTIQQLQQPLLDGISKKIKESLVEFIPQIKNVEIEISEDRRRYALRQQLEIYINDGNKTKLEYKGDGVKSLAALGLLKNKSIKEGMASITAIEEPESHLHPGAIHILRDTIYDLADVNQVILSTHNPLFVDRNKIKSNIIVNSGKATQAKSIREIRNLLGVKASDNLTNASYVLVVEGEDDVISTNAILQYYSPKIKKALKSNFLIIDKIGGAGNLSYKLSLLKNSLCFYHVLLDNDDAGRKAFEKAKTEDQLKIKDVTLINCRGMVDSEFEDCLNVDIYKDMIQEEYGVLLIGATFKNNKKWSDKIKATFQKQGKPWNDSIKEEVKFKVAKCVEKNPAMALSRGKRNSIDALISNLEKIIE